MSAASTVAIAGLLVAIAAGVGGYGYGLDQGKALEKGRQDADSLKTVTDQIITIDLPPTVHETPAEEAAIALDDVPVDPVLAKPASQVVTTTITMAKNPVSGLLSRRGAR